MLSGIIDESKEQAWQFFTWFGWYALDNFLMRYSQYLSLEKDFQVLNVVSIFRKSSEKV